MRIYQLVTDYHWDGVVTESVSTDLEVIKNKWLELDKRPTDIYVWENGEYAPDGTLNPNREFREPEEEE